MRAKLVISTLLEPGYGFEHSLMTLDISAMGEIKTLLLEPHKIMVLDFR